MREVEAAAEILRKDYKVESDIWSLTSVNELRRDGLACEHWNLLNPCLLYTSDAADEPSV